MHPSRQVLGPTQPPIQWVRSLSRGVKRQDDGVDHPPSSSAEIKEKVQLLPLWAFVAYSRVNSTFPFLQTFLYSRFTPGLHVFCNCSTV